MRRSFFALTFLLAFPVLFAQSNEPAQVPPTWQEVKVVYNAAEVADMDKGEDLSTTINTSLNFGTKSKFRKNCLDELRKEAAEKGYSVILIDESASKEKRFSKRGIEITMAGTAYKG